jgi:HD-GYP domain-containing protein (c-di-GMP phosphodiesterase class II)
LLVRWHHEWWNGGGYPDGLHGEEIPLACRILRLADSFVALTSSRPYREAYAPEVARQMIIERAAIEFDPRVVQTFLELALPEQVQPATETALPINERNEGKEMFSSFMK